MVTLKYDLLACAAAAATPVIFFWVVPNNNKNIKGAPFCRLPLP